MIRCAGSAARFRRLGVVAAICAGLIGCGNQSGRLALEGTVFWQGRPLDKGSVLFVPAEGHVGPKLGAEIVDGQYQIAETRGATPGTYRVEVRSDNGERPHSTTDAKRRVAVDKPNIVIPAEYNSQSRLKAIVSAERTKFDFDLPIRSP